MPGGCNFECHLQPVDHGTSPESRSHQHPSKEGLLGLFLNWESSARCVPGNQSIQMIMTKRAKVECSCNHLKQLELLPTKHCQKVLRSCCLLVSHYSEFFIYHCVVVQIEIPVCQLSSKKIIHKHDAKLTFPPPHGIRRSLAWESWLKNTSFLQKQKQPPGRVPVMICV